MAKELEGIIAEIEDIAGYCSTTYDETNGEELSERLTTLDVYLARTAVMLSDSLKIYNYKLGVETEKLLKRKSSITPSVLNNIVKGKCSIEGRVLKLCERLNRTITHQLDAIRTQLSYIKHRPQ